VSGSTSGPRAAAAPGGKRASLGGGVGGQRGFVGGPPFLSPLKRSNRRGTALASAPAQPRARPNPLHPPGGVEPSSSPNATAKYISLKYGNECDMPIIAAVHYKNLEGEWATGGWFSLPAGQTKEVARTRNTFFYVRAFGA
jgi:hypothetical protein